MCNFFSLSVCLSLFLSSSNQRYFLFCLTAVPPDILDHPTSTDMVVREGSNVSLRCAASGSPTPNITWRRESGEIIPLGNQVEGEFIL